MTTLIAGVAFFLSVLYKKVAPITTAVPNRYYITSAAVKVANKSFHLRKV